MSFYALTADSQANVTEQGLHSGCSDGGRSKAMLLMLLCIFDCVVCVDLVVIFQLLNYLVL